MNEPTRLLSSPESELERALLHAGRSYTASDSVRAKTLLALGISAVATSSAPSAAAATSSVTKAAIAKMAVAVLVLGAVAVPVWRYLGRHASSAPAEHAPVNAAARLPVASVALAPAPIPAAPIQSSPVEPAGAEVTAPPPAPRALRPGSGRAPAKPASSPPLSAELTALDAARTSLSHSDPAAALVALDAYARNFPHGRLKIEAEVLRIGALAKSGQSEAARTRAEAFLRVHPDSVLASRVRSYAGL